MKELSETTASQSSGVDRNCISYWLPPLVKADLPVPKTRIVKAAGELAVLLDGEMPPGFETLLHVLALEATEVGGFPVFLRTGHGSGKHQWRETCFVPDAASLGQHVVNLVEWSHMDIFGELGTEVWAVRELVPTTPLFHCEGYGGFPVVPEVRVFIRGDEIEHVQPYWPPKAVEEGRPDREDWRELLAASSERVLGYVTEWATLAGEAAGALWKATGEERAFWSMDFLEDADGKWWLTDMADGDRSFRWDTQEAASSRLQDPEVGKEG